MRINLLAIPLALVTAATGCIKPEPKNSEADIEKCIVQGNVLIADAIISNSDVMLMVRKDASRQMAPEFTLTQGARITPRSGTSLDFSTDHEYTVVSESGKWRKTYIIRAISDLKLDHNFECWDMAGDKYYVMYDTIREGAQVIENQYIWASGNGALAMIFGNKSPEEYPTGPTADGEGYGGEGRAARLRTVSTGLGSSFGKPFAAGNLFIGSFDASSAMARPLEATQFGFPTNKKPKTFRGYYKYRAGETFKDRDGKVVADRTDSCRLYAILYEGDDRGTKLNGTNALTSPRVVARAIVEEPPQTLDGQWKEFVVEFDYGTNVVDPAKLADYKYNLAIVFSSSSRGDIFAGAVGSTLLVDNVEIITY